MLQKPRSSPSSSSSSSSGLGCKIVSWVGSGIYTAFFVSLDRCSCVKLDTIDIYEPVKEQPLLFHSHRRSLSVNSSIALTSSQHHAFSRRRSHSKARHNSSSACKNTRRRQDNDDEEEEEEEEHEEDEDRNNEEEEEVLSIRPR